MATALITGRTRGGEEWVPRFVIGLNSSRCIGCGRCFKVCPRDVFELVEREQDEDDDCEETSMVMKISNALDCIGCEACSKVCSKSCLTHDSLALAG